MWKEFKAFAIRGNVIDMAVGIIIGAAFTLLVQSLVADVLMPPLSLLSDFSDYKDAYVLLQHGVPVLYVAVGLTLSCTRPQTKNTTISVEKIAPMPAARSASGICV